ncbi:5276_t:CDS:2 [Funneliformis geosporum]|uniref:5276_t:CDS:1 n=1 Tax=Funneliformis geosporum TaxID=1117311 RepID=A0A9W4SLW5_9GLOM|nr:5276_t:CDS:2 [Funneliformis geosporum]
MDRDNFSGYMSAEVSESSIEFKNGSLHVYPEDLSKIPPPLLEKFGVETSPSRYKKDFPGGSLSDKEKINQLEKLLEIAKKNDNKAEINNLEQELQALKSQTKGNSSSEKLPNSESNKGNKRNVFPSNLKEEITVLKGKLKILVNKLVDRYAPPQIKNSPEIRQFINSSMNLIDTIADEKIGKETINILAKIFKQAAQNEQVIEGSGLAVLQKTGTETEVKNLINDFAQHLNKLTEAGGKNNLSNEREASIIERLTQNNSNPQPSQDDTADLLKMLEEVMLDTQIKPKCAIELKNKPSEKAKKRQEIFSLVVVIGNLLSMVFFTTYLPKQLSDKALAREGFDFEQTKKWINLGFNPNDYELVSFVKNKLDYSAEDIPIANHNIKTFREIYQKSLEQKQQEQFEDLQLQEAINQSLLSPNFLVQETNEARELQKALALSREEENEIDTGWLTDDNIAYILERDEIIKSAKNIQVKTDTANLYLQVEKAKKNEAIDNDISAATEEIKEISNFLKQVGKKYGSNGNSIINENALSEMVFRENPRQPNT